MEFFSELMKKYRLLNMQMVIPASLFLDWNCTHFTQHNSQIFRRSCFCFPLWHQCHHSDASLMILSQFRWNLLLEWWFCNSINSINTFINFESFDLQQIFGSLIIFVFNITYLEFLFFLSKLVVYRYRRCDSKIKFL